MHPRWVDDAHEAPPIRSYGSQPFARTAPPAQPGLSSGFSSLARDPQAQFWIRSAVTLPVRRFAGGAALPAVLADGWTGSVRPPRQRRRPGAVEPIADLKVQAAFRSPHQPGPVQNPRGTGTSPVADRPDRQGSGQLPDSRGTSDS